ncbi:hypothetical protein [Ruegeria atlantica]|uniref:hypothetical protein n=1 Tax=Ruegeria atlantica TaxID=81569 RepID=UPI00147CBFFD|nr:hypothetical protein [Ruegeria atlantica]
MRAGQSGRVAIQWGQTEIDGLEAAPLSFLRVGAAWSWRGQLQFLAESTEQAIGRSRGAHGCVAKNLGHYEQLQILPEVARGLLVLTNGAQTFSAILFQVAGETAPVLVFDGDCPARDQEFWISEFTEIEIENGEVPEVNTSVVAFPHRQIPNLGNQGERRAVSASLGAD